MVIVHMRVVFDVDSGGVVSRLVLGTVRRDDRLLAIAGRKFSYSALKFKKVFPGALRGYGFYLEDLKLVINQSVSECQLIIDFYENKLNTLGNFSFSH